MSEIKVGDYVRTKGGHIDKVLEILPYHENDKNISEYDYISTKTFKLWKRYQFEEIITKHSFNIIDLIEEGDMLNKNEVIEVKGMGLCIYDINNKNWLPIGNIDYQMGIELAIVTHEQMKESEYKVNE